MCRVLGRVQTKAKAGREQFIWQMKKVRPRISHVATLTLSTHHATIDSYSASLPSEPFSQQGSNPSNFTYHRNPSLIRMIKSSGV